MNEVHFRNRKLNIGKLMSFGFNEGEEGYIYTADLMDGQMEMTVAVSKSGEVAARVTDKLSGEAYVLHRVAEASGAFVGQIREEYEALLEKISRECFEPDVFKSEQAKEVIAYVWETYGDSLEYLWQKFPDNAVVRRKDNQKWYAAILTVAGRKLGLDSDSPMEILDLRMAPEKLEGVIDNQKYFPGYHMNKKHWVTICLDGRVSFEEIAGRIDESYRLAGKK